MAEAAVIPWRLKPRGQQSPNLGHTQNWDGQATLLVPDSRFLMR